MNYLLLFLIFIIIYVYISYYYRYPAVTKVLHAYEDNFETSIMMQKHPIVLLDVTTESLEQLKEKILPYLIAKQTLNVPSIWNTNRTKYLLLRSDQATEIHLLPASKKLTKEHVPDPEETLITLQIQPNHVVILPFHWHYYTDVPLRTLGINDYITWILP